MANLAKFQRTAIVLPRNLADSSHNLSFYSLTLSVNPYFTIAFAIVSFFYAYKGTAQT